MYKLKLDIHQEQSRTSNVFVNNPYPYNEFLKAIDLTNSGTMFYSGWVELSLILYILGQKTVL